MLKKNKKKTELADFIYNRLYSRYIKPYEFKDEDYKKNYKNGFSMMASFCLLIETFQSFKKGLGNSRGKGEKLFKDFFKEQKLFNDFNGSKFYKNIRCGILHQGETTGGWKINRKGGEELLKDNSINANIFRDNMEKVLKNYKDELKKDDFYSENWDNFRIKMESVIKNCE